MRWESHVAAASRASSSSPDPEVNGVDALPIHPPPAPRPPTAKITHGRGSGRYAGDADLLVVGSRGYGGWKGLLMGSVSAQCVTQVPCPVAVVRDGEPNDAP